MKPAIVCNSRSLSVSARSAGLVLIAAALNWSCPSATAQESRRAARATEVAVPDRTLFDLERDFWACDYEATSHGLVDAGTAIQCGIATENLKLRKFNGDFNAMVSWWKKHKALQHAALARATAP